MALQRPLSKALACHGCQQWLLRSFIAGIGGHSTLPSPHRPAQRRPFSKTPKILNEARERLQKEAAEEQHPLNEINDEAVRTTLLDPETPSQKPSEESLPWYLQVQQPIEQVENPFSARQRLPELPEHPPSVLQPLLQHISINLGMDDLSLLDLRSLDPPPALGANLVMIVGTARSEKHLHVSADRLCRWLRSEYKLTPYADGLLGRNELKIKMRRKAKRSRLLSAVGAKATADTELDDGIRTGWVCVNVGRVKDGDLPPNEEKLQRREGIVGFGARTDGCNIVVQLMTEEKRGEIDLENLWTGIMSRARRDIGKDDAEESEAGTEAVPEENMMGSEIEQSASSLPPDGSSISTMYQPGTQVSTQNAGQQLRAYHTSTRRLQAMPGDRSDFETGSFAQPPSPVDIIETTPYDSKSIHTLTALLRSLKSMNKPRAFEQLSSVLPASQKLALDNGSSDLPAEATAEETDTPFLHSFYSAMPTFPGPEHWHLHIELLAHARSLGHQDIHSDVLFAQLTNMQIAGLVPEERTFKLVIRSVLAPLGKVKAYDGSGRQPGQLKMQRIFNVLEDMEVRGYNPLSPDILALLHQACIGQPHQTQQHPHQTSSISPLLGAARLRRHIQDNDWPAFWRSWRSYPQRFLPRTAEMYGVLFDAIGDDKLEDAKEMRDVLGTYLYEMEREQPPVVLEEDPALARAAVKALEAVEPRLKKEGSKEWGGWYERCVYTLQRAAS